MLIRSKALDAPAARNDKSACVYLLIKLWRRLNNLPYKPACKAYFIFDKAPNDIKFRTRAKPVAANRAAINTIPKAKVIPLLSSGIAIPYIALVNFGTNKDIMAASNPKNTIPAKSFNETAFRENLRASFKSSGLFGRGL